MKKLFSSFALPLLLLIAALLGFVLPTLTGLMQDLTIFDNSTVMAVQSANVSYSTELSAMQRLRLQENSAPQYEQQLESGLSMTETDAVQTAQTFLQDIAYVPLAFDDCTASASLYLFEDNYSMLLWKVSVRFGSWSGQLVLDDASAAVLSMELLDEQELVTSPFIDWTLGATDETQTDESFLTLAKTLAAQFQPESYTTEQWLNYRPGASGSILLTYEGGLLALSLDNGPNWLNYNNWE